MFIDDFDFRINPISGLDYCNGYYNTGDMYINNDILYIYLHPNWYVLGERKTTFTHDHIRIDNTINDKRLRAMGYNLIGAVDESGNSAIAGSIVAAYVIMKPGFNNKDIKDCKLIQHNDELLDELADLIKRNAIVYAIGEVSVQELLTMSNYQGALLAMKRAYLNAGYTPEILLIDGKHFLDVCDREIAITDGDLKDFNIACASILAKSYRNHTITSLPKSFHDNYNLSSNKGYSDLKHTEGIFKHGITDLHKIKSCKKYMTPEDILKHNQHNAISF